MEISSWEELFSTVEGNQISDYLDPSDPTLISQNGPIPPNLHRVTATRSLPLLLPNKTLATNLLTLENSQVFSSHSELAAFQNWRGQQGQQGTHCERGQEQEQELTGWVWAQTSRPTHSHSSIFSLHSPHLGP